MRTVHGSQLAKAKPTVVDGYTLDSKAEARRYGQLILLQAARQISELQIHPRLPIVINERKIGRGYVVMDFSYLEYVDGAYRKVYEDAKGGADTQLANYKRKILAALYPTIIIRVTTA